MRTTLRKIRQLLREADEHASNRVNPKSIEPMLVAIEKRLYEETEAFCQDLTQNDPDNEIESIISHRLRGTFTFLVICTFSTMVEFTVEFKMVNSSPFEWIAEFSHGEASGVSDDDDADELGRDQMDSWQDYDELEEVCLVALQPQADTSGRWWADENYYPIRPFVEGESTELKPVSSWTVVDGPTGDVVSEAKSSVKDHRKLNRYCRVHVMMETARTSLIAIKELFSNATYKEKYGTILPAISMQGNVPRVGFGFKPKSNQQNPTNPSISYGIYVEMNVSFGDVFLPKIDIKSKSLSALVSRASDSGWTTWKEDIAMIKTDIKEVVGPSLRGDGLWWADENMYAIRPLLKGEEPHLRPDPKWIAIDINTHEEWKDGKGYDDDVGYGF